MTAREYLRFAGELFGLEPTRLGKKIEELLELVGLQKEKKRIGGFSRGMKQRLGLAQALVNKPEVLFLDEPTSALDPIGRKDVLETITAISGECTVFFATHILADVERVCNRVGILRQGQLVTEATMAELRENFAQRALRLKVTGESQPLVADLQNKRWTQVVEEQDDSILLTVFDLAMAQREIPRLLTEHNLGIQRLEQVELNLEDIFVRLVNNSEE